MKSIKLIILLLFSLQAGTYLYGQGGVISAANFMKLYKTDKNLCIIDAGKTKDYTAFHIKKSISIPYNTFNKAGDIPALIKTPAAMAKIFGNKGISNNCTIVLYDGGSQKYSSRIYWILKYLGAKNVYILHKNMAAWRKVKIPITSAPFHKKPTQFKLNLQPQLHATKQAVEQAIKNHSAIIIDARKAEEHAGTTKYSIGHIPNAININYTDFLTPTGAFKSKESILQILKNHGINGSKPIILYCQTSIRAAVEFVALTAILKWNHVSVYDGAYVEWYYNDLPLNKRK